MKFTILFLVFDLSVAAADSGIFLRHLERFNQLRPVRNLQVLKPFTADLYCELFDPAVEEAYGHYNTALAISEAGIGLEVNGSSSGFLFGVEAQGLIQHVVEQKHRLVNREPFNGVFELRIDTPDKLLFIKTSWDDPEHPGAGVIHVCRVATVY